MFREIKFEELVRELHGTRCVVIDVRNPEEISATGKIPNSHNIPLPEISEAFSMANPSDFKQRYGFQMPMPSESGERPELIFSCRSGKRVQTAMGLVSELGYSNIRSYTGSFLDWSANDGSLEPFEMIGKAPPEKKQSFSDLQEKDRPNLVQR